MVHTKRFGGKDSDSDNRKYKKKTSLEIIKKTRKSTQTLKQGEGVAINDQ